MAFKSMSRQHQGLSPSPPLAVWVGYLAARCLRSLIRKLEGAEIPRFTVIGSCKQNTKSQAKCTVGLLF